LIGVVGFGVVRDDDVVGGGGGIRVESGDERQSEECSADLGGDETGAIPAKVSVKIRPTATAGLANDVLLVNQ
jgi:hypothetical protein